GRVGKGRRNLGKRVPGWPGVGLHVRMSKAFLPESEARHRAPDRGKEREADEGVGVARSTTDVTPESKTNRIHQHRSDREGMLHLSTSLLFALCLLLPGSLRDKPAEL
ncbi:unnamed protein product, partial [Phaeothamnion confervicola]